MAYDNGSMLAQNILQHIINNDTYKNIKTENAHMKNIMIENKLCLGNKCISDFNQLKNLI